MATERNANMVPSLQVKSNAGNDADVILWGDPTTHRLLVNTTITGSISTTTGANATIGDNRKTVTTAGTRVQLSSSSVPILKVVIQALQANTGFIAVGGSTVVAASGTERGYILAPFNAITITVSDLNLIYLDSTVSGEGVSYYYEV